MGNSESDLKKVCKNAKILKGLPIQGSTVYSAKDTLAKWIKKD
jgi:hypothetical protein